MKRVLHGAVDMHCHSGPSPMPRRVTHVEAARQAAEAGFRAMVAKCHYHSTVFDILSMQDQLAGVPIELFGGVALNSQVGGLNPHAADLAFKMGGRIVWFPTISSTAHLRHASRDEAIRAHFVPRGVMESEEVDIFGPDGDLVPQVEQILRIAKEADGVVSSGHMAPDRVIAMLEQAKALGLTKLVVSHPNYIIEADKDGDAQRFVELGATIEHCLGLYVDGKHFDFAELKAWIDAIGPDHTSLVSDLGQVGNPLPVDAFFTICEQLLDSGVSEADVRTMVVDNPSRLLGLDA
ncbi:MAG TPA: DUF6282 family protein [Solirubrobacter sp.]|nr:DUF6282 family protein [Solirubrobacter sp.]